MTQKQFNRYKNILEEIEPIKEFLFWCGKKYKSEEVRKYRFKISFGKGKRLLLQHQDSGFYDRVYEMPVELQDRIIDIIEQYVDEKQKELDEI